MQYSGSFNCSAIVLVCSFLGGFLMQVMKIDIFNVVV